MRKSEEALKIKCVINFNKYVLMKKITKTIRTKYSHLYFALPLQKEHINLHKHNQCTIELLV